MASDITQSAAVRGFGTVLLAIAFEPALAQGWLPLSDPSVEPTNASTTDRVTYIVRWDGCGNLLEPTIERSGNIVQIDQPIDATCGVPVGGGYVQYDLGYFPPGQYTVHIVPCQHIFSGVPCFPGDSPLDVRFSVIGVATPALGEIAMFVCCAVLLLVGARRTQQGQCS